MPLTSSGYGLYFESLGKEMELHTDPYQYIGMLKVNGQRAVCGGDVDLHKGKLTCEQSL